MAATMLQIYTYNIQVGDTEPEGVGKTSKNMRAYRHKQKKRSSDLFTARVGLLYFVQGIVHVTIHVTGGHWPLEIE